MTPMIEGPKRKIELFLLDLFTAFRKCKSCPLGSQPATTTGVVIEHDPHVFSNVNYSKIFIVGQNPGMTEVMENEPFVGESGAMFDMELKVNGISRLDFYITNAVKCFTQGNSKPTPNSISMCSYILHAELAAVKPVLIVTLGEVAFSVFSDQNYSDSLGKISLSTKSVPGGPYRIYPIYHPSPKSLADLTRMGKFKSQIKRLAAIVRAGKTGR